MSDAEPRERLRVQLRRMEIDGHKAELRAALRLREMAVESSAMAAHARRLEHDIAERDRLIEVLRLENERQQLDSRQQLDRIMRSRSMRLTRPLRDFGEVLRRVRP